MLCRVALEGSMLRCVRAAGLLRIVLLTARMLMCSEWLTTLSVICISDQGHDDALSYLFSAERERLATALADCVTLPFSIA